MTPTRENTRDRFHLFVDGVKDYAFIQFDGANRVTDWNAGAERLLGYTEAEILGCPGDIFFTPEDRERGMPEQEVVTARERGTAEDERWHIRKDGTRFRASGVMTRLCDDHGNLAGFAKVFRDVTEREQVRERLQRSLVEKDVLLREIHHRVKNNLQVIVSLLGLQARYIQDPGALASIEETTNRVRAIARIHEALYGNSDLASIHFSSYLNQLVQDLTAFYDVSQRIETRVSAAPVTLDIDLAVPLALITNELICNAMKHGFPDRENGSIVVEFAMSEGGGRLTVADNGIGLPPGFDAFRAASMGFNLIRILAEQLEAELEVQSSGGTQVVVRFPPT
ncbi:MAG TPA: histidine kinase dimerization/phosphoacceptor domain -containing protein [Bryobacteraceae bacterium]|nr:histidine kinase dimerization/phosphoacceptor domain -containing protein [Bryobacteraceae bacterium]